MKTERGPEPGQSLSTEGKILNVLLVEDLEDDRFFFEHALKKAKVAASLFMAQDGIEAIDFLKKERAAGEAGHFPDVMFLDLKMPGCDGFDVLRWMGGQGLLGTLRLFVLSGSAEPKDMELARELGAGEYLVKPLSAERLRQLLSETQGPLAKVGSQGTGV